MKWASSASRVVLLLKAAMGVALVAAISLIAMSCCSVWGNKWYYAAYKHEIQFVGTKGQDGQVEYFSVRVGGHNAQAIPAECELEFHWKGKKYLIREVELNDLAKMGVGAESTTGDTRGVVTAFLAGKDDSHRDFGVEFHFRNGRIYHFYAWHSSSSTVACPFMISIAHQQPVPFPLRDEQLQKSFGAPESVVAVRGT
jgi:hypothetical protein